MEYCFHWDLEQHQITEQLKLTFVHWRVLFFVTDCRGSSKQQEDMDLGKDEKPTQHNLSLFNLASFSSSCTHRPLQLTSKPYVKRTETKDIWVGKSAFVDSYSTSAFPNNENSFASRDQKIRKSRPEPVIVFSSIVIVTEIDFCNESLILLSCLPKAIAVSDA